MNPPLSRTAKRWLLAVSLLGISLLAVIAWLGLGQTQPDQPPPVAEQTAEPEPVRAEAPPPRPLPRPLFRQPVPAPVPAPSAAPAPAPLPTPAYAPLPTVDAGPAARPFGNRFQGGRSLRALVDRVRNRPDGGAPAAR